MICNLCPRRCGALRTPTAGEGLCGMPEAPVLARAALHHWEEPPISGKRGSGTVFFSGCSLGCVFCQNEAISHRRFGTPIAISRLREIFYELIDQGAHNTGGYERLETLRALEGKVQIYLPDYKYRSPERAARYSGAADYPETAAAAIREMVRQTGPMVLEDGLLKRGTLIRHLILPGGLQEAKAVMDWVAASFPAGTAGFSLMSQYIPWGWAGEYPEINRPLRRSEARAAQAYMAALGLEGFTQEAGAAEADYIPPFDLSGVEKG